MVRVPRYQSRVLPEGTNARSQAIAARVDGAPLREAGAMLNQIAVDARAKQRNGLKAEKERQAIETLARLEFEAKQKQGKNAAGATKSALEQYDQFYSKVEVEIGDPALRDEITNRLKEHRTRLEYSILPHEAGQLKQSRLEDFQAVRQNSLDGIGLHPLDSETNNRRVRDMLETVDLEANELGWSDEVVKAKKDDILSQATYTNIVALTAQGDYQNAKALYDRSGFLLNAEQKIQAERQVQKATILGQTQQTADVIMDQYRAGEMTEREIYERAREIEDPELRAEVEGELDRRLSRDKRLKAEERKGLYESSWNALEENGGDILALKRSPAWAGMDPTDQRNLEIRANQLIQGVMDPPSNSQEYYALRRQAVFAPEQFMARPLHEVQHQVSKQEYTELNNIQLQMQGRAAQPVDFSDMNTEEQDFAASLLQAGLEPAKATKDPESKEWKIRQRANEQIRQWKAVHKTDKIPGEERRKIYADLTAKTVVPDGGWMWFDSEEPAGALMAEGSVRDARAIPQDIRQQFIRTKREALKRQGIQVSMSDQQILETYGPDFVRIYNAELLK